MSRIKTLWLGVVFVAFAAPTLAQGSLIRDVAACVGRLSAQMEHHWLFEDKSSDSIETQRAHMIDILQALMTPELARSVLSHRIEAKHAHASLLTRASFSSDPKVATWAHAQSERQLQSCSGLLLAEASPAPAKHTLAHDRSSAAKTVNQSAVRVSR